MVGTAVLVAMVLEFGVVSGFPSSLKGRVLKTNPTHCSRLACICSLAYFIAIFHFKIFYLVFSVT